MELRDCLILIGLGGLFIILGVVGIVWGRREESAYYEVLAKRRGDVREFMNHWPPRHQPGALKLGGWIAIAVGVSLLVTGGIFCLLI